jgi:predicted outer membrane protein
MKTIHARILSALAASTLALSTVVGCAGMSDRIQSKTLQDATVSSDDRAKIEKLVNNLPPRPRLAALQMIAKYGLPEEATTDHLVWHHAGPYKQVNVTRAEHPHDFPLPHMDYLEHTITYHVPAEKAAALSAYDGSLTFDRTRGEMSARCDVEAHNILTLNLAHDIVTGKKTTEEARKAFGRTVMEDFQGKHPADVMTLRIDPPKEAAYSDQPVIPGSPKRAATIGSDAKKTDDAEILAFLAAADMNEVIAADQATKEKIDARIMQYARKLHQEHGANLDKTLALGQRLDVTPINTPAVDKLRVKGARELAGIVPLDGDRFGEAYLAAMVKGHTEVLLMIDTKLKDAEDEGLKKHLTLTRQDVARHLEEAKNMQNGMER